MNKYIKLIESKAIREYLNEIGYIPSTFESAYIIEKSKKLALSKKHELWNEIIDTMPDEKEFRFSRLTLHEYLKKYIEIQIKLYDRFLKKEQNAVYTCSSGVVVDWESRKPLIKNPFYWCNIYTDLKLCIQDAHKKKYPLFDVRKHYIKTKSDDTDYSCIWADLTPNGEIINIGEIFVLDDDDADLYQFLKNETVSVPLPFKDGDLIYSKNWDCELVEFKSYKNGYIYANEIKGACSLCLNNEFDIEFADKFLCMKIFKEAILFCNEAILDFIEKKEILSKEEIYNIYKEM